MAFAIDVGSGSIVWPVILSLIAARTLYGAIWRLFFSPIARIPGPKFAALTFWNEFYYDVILGGQYTWKLEEYHRQYGPIIRINPYEVHIRDSSFYDQLYVGASKRKTNKWSWAMRMFAQEDSSVFDTLDHDKHRQRREPWNPYFSKQSVTRLQPTLIQSKVDKLCERLSEHQQEGKPVVMIYAYATLTVDIISEYSYPEGYNYLDKPDFDRQNYDAFMTFTQMCHLFKQFRWLIPLFHHTPLWLLKNMDPDAYLAVSFRRDLHKQAEELHRRRDAKQYDREGKRPSLLEAVLESKLPESDKAPERMASEAQTAIAAGTLTSTHVLKFASYHILAKPAILERLMTELERAIPDPDAPLTLKELESLEYTAAIMWESLRGTHGTTHRLQRICPDQAIQYRNYSLPPGTIASMTGVHLHNDPEIFPDPFDFKPERWLPLQSEGQRLQRFIGSFGKGSRQCIGIELAKAEILTTLATVFRKFGRGMELYETEQARDIDIQRDFFNPLPSKQSNGLMVMFKKG